MLNNFIKETENKTPIEIQEIKEFLKHSLTDADLLFRLRRKQTYLKICRISKLSI